MSSKAPLLALYTPRNGSPIYPAIDVMLMMSPDFCARILGNTALIMPMGPKKFVSKLFFISVIGISSNGPVIPTPALLIKTSMALVLLNNVSTQARMESGLVTSNFRIGNMELVYFSGNRLVP